jgi:hypothetical protein
MNNLPANILEAISHPGWWGSWFPRPDEWKAWHAFLAAVFALPMDEGQLAVYRECTGRMEPPTVPAREVWAPPGRRGGKTRIAATVAGYLAVFVDWRRHLAPGERATIMLLAADRKQARVAMRYLKSLFVEPAGLRKLIDGETQESLELKNRVVIEVATASYKTTRGYSIAAIIADEVAFWSTDEGSANPAAEIIAALRPAMMRGALLMAVSSPYSRRGPLWDSYRRHYGKDDDPILVWKAATRTMNPTVPQEVVDEAMEVDPASASAEYLAEFRTDVESFVSREVVDAATVAGRHELPRADGVTYHGFCDPSGGSNDSMTVAVAHAVHGTDRVVLDLVREVRPPFSPDDVVREFAELLLGYNIRTVYGDRYAGEWPRERFRAHGVGYQVSGRAKSDIYRDLLPLLNSGRVELLDVPRLASQLYALERRTARGGKDSIDHPPMGRDDLVNAAAGAALLAASADRIRFVAPIIMPGAAPNMFGYVGGGDASDPMVAVNGIPPDGQAALMPYERWGN